MITVIYSTHKNTDYNIKFKQHLIDSSEIKNIEILEYQNNNQYSLAQIYNSGITKSIHNIVVCCHNDIKLEKGWGKKLIKDFEESTEYGIIGKAGSCYFPESGVYWERMFQTMVGQVYHHPEGQKKWLNKYSPRLPFLIPVVTIDGLFISFDKNKIKNKFDETIGKFHFYDHGFCIPNFLNGVKIGVTSSFEITHESIGQPNQEFFESKQKFIQKYQSVLPLDLKPNYVYHNPIKEKKIKNVGKVAIIIPTKSKIELLFNCIDSFHKNCNSELYDIFVADTGSSSEEKNKIKEKYSGTNVKLIEFDYYNFAKINNQVVINNIGPSYEFLLFCNNDIKIMNNVILNMLKVFKENRNVGSVGARLHFGDNTIQHDGMILFYDKNKNLQISHKNLRNYYNFSDNLKEVVGNTGALLMIRKTTFEKCGLFNENYINCFEDVELNLKCLLLGLKNYCDGNSVAYHYESETRGEDPENINKLLKDYRENLFPFIMNNINKLQPHILQVT